MIDDGKYNGWAVTIESADKELWAQIAAKKIAAGIGSCIE